MHFSDIQKSDTENTQMLELTIIGFVYFHIIHLLINSGQLHFNFAVLSLVLPRKAVFSIEKPVDYSLINR
jgi:hypothetical protein